MPKKTMSTAEGDTGNSMVHATIDKDPGSVWTFHEAMEYARDAFNMAREISASGPMTPARAIAVNKWGMLCKKMCERASDLALGDYISS
jgi:hypothetical protein